MASSSATASATPSQQQTSSSNPSSKKKKQIQGLRPGEEVLGISIGGVMVYQKGEKNVSREEIRRRAHLGAARQLQSVADGRGYGGRSRTDSQKPESQPSEEATTQPSSPNDSEISAQPKQQQQQT